MLRLFQPPGSRIARRAAPVIANRQANVSRRTCGVTTGRLARVQARIKGGCGAPIRFPLLSTAAFDSIVSHEYPGARDTVPSRRMRRRRSGGGFRSRAWLRRYNHRDAWPGPSPLPEGSEPVYQSSGARLFRCMTFDDQLTICAKRMRLSMVLSNRVLLGINS
jgi:hypothetical protein